MQTRRHAALAGALGVFLLLGALPVRGEESLNWPPQEAVEEEEEEPDLYADDPADLRVPAFRFELGLRMGYMVSTKFKKGPAFFAHTIQLHRDTHLPMTPHFGFRLLADIKVHPRLVVGGSYSRFLIEGPRRHLHHHGVTLQAVYLPPHTPTRTAVDAQFGEAYLRYVVRDNKRLRLAIGTGVTWASLRLRLSTRIRRSDGRVETFFLPTFGYFVSFRVHENLSLFAESTLAVVAPFRVPSYLSESRYGLRFPLWSGAELIVAAFVSSAQIEDVRDLWGGKARPNHRWNQASWTIVGGELGLTVRF